ncbi:MAG: hypothetical protein ACLR93_09575 [Alistipes onderdonkii]
MHGTAGELCGHRLKPSAAIGAPGSVSKAERGSPANSARAIRAMLRASRAS